VSKTVNVVIPGKPGGLINLRGMIFKTGEPVDVPAEIAADFKLEGVAADESATDDASAAAKASR
jgi:hypothetical protein